MGYTVRIVRAQESAPILLDEWKQAVSSIEGIRLTSVDAHTIRNPRTGQTINIPVQEGDAEVYFPDDREWHPVFRWLRNAAQFNGGSEFGDVSHPVWRAATAIANLLNARIRGDEGDYYDSETGEAIDV
jgi:hypothetical protein